MLGALLGHVLCLLAHECDQHVQQEDVGEQDVGDEQGCRTPPCCCMSR
uniref:Uncharacterized protein n=1 Tax=Anguilla anguilla TaxID=7936 RepID=A0A0E9QAM5_ANGAN